MFCIVFYWVIFYFFSSEVDLHYSSRTVWTTVGIDCLNSNPTKIFNLHSSEVIAAIVTWKSGGKVLKNYAKHCSNFKRTLPTSSLNLDVDPYRKLCMHNCQKIEKLWPSGCSDVSAHPSRRNHNWNWSLYQKMPSYLLKPKRYSLLKFIEITKN